MFITFNNFVFEELLGTSDYFSHYKRKRIDIEFIKNPVSFNKIQPNCRAILSENNLFVADDDGLTLLHVDIVETLRYKFQQSVNVDLYRNMYEQILLQRYEKTNSFYLSESYPSELIQIPKYYKSLETNIKKYINKMKPNFNFVIKPISDANMENDLNDIL